MAIIGLIIIGLCILWILGIYWPVFTGEREHLISPALEPLLLTIPVLGIVFGGLLMIFGIYSAFSIRKRRRMLIKIMLKKFPYICTKCGTFSNVKNKYCENCGEKDTLRETLLQDYEQYSEKLKEKEKKEFLQKVARKQIGTKMEAASNVTYMLRIDKEVGESGEERINYICGYCGLKNNLKTIDEEHGIFQCLNCGAENHLLK